MILIDIGSANGIFYLFNKINKICKCKIYTFEPEDNGYNNIEVMNNIINYNLGLFNSNKKLNLFITNKEECSSILEPNIELLKKYYNYNRFNVKKNKLIECKKIIDVIDEQVIDCIKLDTQGSEYEILEGFEELILNTKVIITEVEFVEMYKKQKLFNDLYNLLDEKQYEIFKFIRLVYFSKDKTLSFDNNFNIIIYNNKLKSILYKYKLDNFNELSILLDNKFEIINRLLNTTKNIYDDINKLIDIEFTIKKLLPNNILNSHDDLNMDLMFGDVIFINKKYSNDNNTIIIKKNL